MKLQKYNKINGNLYNRRRILIHICQLIKVTKVEALNYEREI
jgi:hypothetical protein